ncbi:MAG: hypothetical protein K0R40_2088 [Burkholderiales bacterium]|jgi:uncharacterized protein|nr:hypothetical protein [Burkholderiales bacterium]
MGRLLILIALVVFAVWLVRRALRGTAGRQKPPVQGDLVACARCGVHLPRAEAREADGRLFCGDEHARLGAGGR